MTVNFDEIFHTSGSDKGIGCHEYGSVYERFLNNININSILEIGVHQGSSLVAWRKIFPNSAITGVDITDKNIIQSNIRKSNADIIIANSVDITLDKKYDVIVDDGSHTISCQFHTFINLESTFNHYYFIEDVLNSNVSILKEYIEDEGFVVKIFPSKTLFQHIFVITRKV